MSFEDQWAAVRAQALTGAEASDNSQMSLASTGSGGSKQGELVYVEYPWTDGARILAELYTTTNTSVTQVSEEQGRGSEGTAGLASALAMDAVRSSWQHRLKAVRDECEKLEQPMRQAAKDHGENSARIKAAIAAERMAAKPFEKGQ
ncbi:hypothetical protein [Streptomyces sp. NPDC056160]|uniref:hypothetical protein n=1 Tax=Streptomyces sp. NPDC056160 TaxID=3345731 RepID=UPI0035E21CB5